MRSIFQSKMPACLKKSIESKTTYIINHSIQDGCLPKKKKIKVFSSPGQRLYVINLSNQDRCLSKKKKKKVFKTDQVRNKAKKDDFI